MLFVICGSFLAIGLFAELSLGTFRPWASGYRFAGTVHPNAQGGICATLAISSLAYWLSRRDGDRGERSARREEGRSNGWSDWLPAILFAAAIVGLLLAKSRTCVAGCMLGCGILMLFRVSARSKVLVGFAGAWSLAAAVFVLALSGVDLAAEAESALYMGRQEESEALSGRLPIWTELSNYVAERPWQGYGYAAFWTEDRIDTISADVMWVFREAHSSFFEMLLSVGGVGLFLFLASALTAAGLAFRRALRGDPYAAYLLALMAFFAVTAFTESSVVWPCLETTALGIAAFQLAFRRGEAVAPSARVAESSPSPSRMAEVQP
jgi:O-antigen ligase